MSGHLDEFDLDIRLGGIRVGSGRIVPLLRDTEAQCPDTDLQCVDTDLECVGNTNVGCPGDTIVGCPGDTDMGCPGDTNVGCPRPTDAATNCCAETDDTCASCWSDCQLCG